MTILWIAVAIVVLILWVMSLVDLFRRRPGTGKTVAWVLLIIILPFVGSVLYWALRPASAAEIQSYADADRDFRETAQRH